MFRLNQKDFQYNIDLLRTEISRGVPTWKIYSIINELLQVPYNDDTYIMQLLKIQGELSDQMENIPNESLIKYNKVTCNRLLKTIIDRGGNVKNDSLVITMTTCRRYNLFEQTVNSFLEYCRDLENYILQWIVVDDNSSIEDRERMKQNYPFMTFIFKEPANKGHAKSMNILRNKIIEINAPFVLHLEDDFRFFVPGKWITKCMAVLKTNPKYGQCLFNRAYGEDMKIGATIWGGHRRYIPHPEIASEKLRYYIHEYATGSALHKIGKQLADKGLANCFYWPHFSLRVGLTRLEVYKIIGEFNESAAHFELEYAKRYRRLYLTTYLDNVICTHIGRRTYERDGSKLNSYDLNNEKQFGQEPKTILDESEIKLDAISLAVSKQEISRNIPKQQIIKAYVLNLKRRQDRLQKFREVNKLELTHFHVFNAIDGMKLKPSLFIQKLFEFNDYKYRRGIVGCAISHILMWAELSSSSNLNGMLIIEDDARLSKNFIAKFLHLLNDCPEADIIFLHHHAYPQWQNINDLNQVKIPIATQWSKEKSINRSMGGTTCYYITRLGATRLLDEIDRKGIKYGIDWIMFHYNVNKVFYTSPFLAFADCAQLKGVDSDIQNDYTGVSFRDELEWLNVELSYWGEKGIKNVPQDLGLPEDENSKIIYKKEKCETRQLLSNFIIFPLTNELEKWIIEYPVHFFIIGRWLFSVPDTMLTFDNIKNHSFNGSHLLISALSSLINSQ